MANSSRLKFAEGTIIVGGLTLIASGAANSQLGNNSLGLITSFVVGCVAALALLAGCVMVALEISPTKAVAFGIALGLGSSGIAFVSEDLVVSSRESAIPFVFVSWFFIACAIVALLVGLARFGLHSWVKR